MPQNSNENEKSKDEEISDQMETKKLGWCEGEEKKHLDSLSKKRSYVQQRLNRASVAKQANVTEVTLDILNTIFLLRRGLNL